jgi:hypothetical protein
MTGSRYVEDQKYARSLRWNAEAGFVRGLLVLGGGGIMIVAGVIGLAVVLIYCWR